MSKGRLVGRVIDLLPPPPVDAALDEGTVRPLPATLITPDVANRAFCRWGLRYGRLSEEVKEKACGGIVD